MSKKNFPVQPLGRLSAIFLLPKARYRLYRVIGAASCVTLGLLMLAGVILPKFIALPFSIEWFVVAGMVIGFICVGSVCLVARGGTKATERERLDFEQRDAELPSTGPTLVTRTFRMVMTALAILLMSVAALSAYAAVELHRPIPPELLILVVPSLLILWRFFGGRGLMF
jgi:hypothetical protein